MSSPAARRRATLRGVVLTFRVCQRTVAVALAWRLHLRPLNRDPGVFPPAASQAHYKPGSFLSWSFSLPQGSTSHHRSVHLPADSGRSDSEHPPEVQFPFSAPSTENPLPETRSNEFAALRTMTNVRTCLPPEGAISPSRSWCPASDVPCPTADGSVVVIGTSGPFSSFERSNDALERVRQ